MGLCFCVSPRISRSRGWCRRHQRGSTRTIGAPAVLHIFRPAVSVSSSRHADHRHPSPYNTSSGPRCSCQRHPKSRKHTGVIYHHIPCPQGSSLHCHDSTDERARGGIFGYNRKRVTLMNYNRFPEPPPPVGRYFSSDIGPLPPALLAVTGCRAGRYNMKFSDLLKFWPCAHSYPLEKGYFYF